MKNILYFLFVALVIPFLTSCEKDTEGVSMVTNYVVFDLTGSSVEQVVIGSQYVEPGYSAFEGEEDVTSDVVIDDDIDTNKLGVYTVNYKAINKDGYEASITRSVIVYNPEAPDTDLSGTYSTDVIRTEADGSSPRPRAFSIKVAKIAPGIFSVNCLLGYFYAGFTGYGSAYEMNGVISLNADNSIDMLSSSVKAWGDGLEAFKKGAFDPGTGKLYWESTYAAHDIFAVTSTPE